MALEPFVRGFGNINRPGRHAVMVEDVNAGFKRHKRILGLAIVERFHYLLRRQNSTLRLGESASVDNVIGLLFLVIVIGEDVLSFRGGHRELLEEVRVPLQNTQTWRIVSIEYLQANVSHLPAKLR